LEFDLLINMLLDCLIHSILITECIQIMYLDHINIVLHDTIKFFNSKLKFFF
jgi:hypothetical protein